MPTDVAPVCKQCGGPIDSVKPQRFCSRACQLAARSATAIRLDPEVHRRLKDAAQERDVSVNWLVGKAVTEFLDRLIPVEEIRWTRDA